MLEKIIERAAALKAGAAKTTKTPRASKPKKKATPRKK
jgi:hypothetical protein